MKMNSLEGKKILSLIRGGDYAHAGEEEAIERVLKYIPKEPNQWLLDVGCGLGGTAHYFQKNDYGKVIGIDIDKETIDYAKNKYPSVQFYAGNVINITEILDKRFEVIYLFNSFYAFGDQAASLTAMNKAAKENAKLVIFDYAAPGNFKDRGNDLLLKTLPNPINLDVIEGMLSKVNWSLDKIELLNRKYELWYSELVKKIEEKRRDIEAIGGADVYRHVLNIYSGILKAIESGFLGGAIVTATKKM